MCECFFEHLCVACHCYQRVQELKQELAVRDVLWWVSAASCVSSWQGTSVRACIQLTNAYCHKVTK